MDIREFDFDLPSELIAQEPAGERSAARLLHLDRVSGSITHSTVSALPNLLGPGDVVVVNNTRVFPARLLGRRVPSGGAVECLLIARAASESCRRDVGAVGGYGFLGRPGASGAETETWRAGGV